MSKVTESTFGLQHTIPRLPVPTLEQTCSLYLKSIVPLQTPEEHENTKKIVQDFLQGDLSKVLQDRLIDLSRSSPNNWLEDNFWLRKAYLEWREPLMVNSNWYILGQEDVNHPITGDGKKPLGHFSLYQVTRAAHMIRRGLEFKEKIERGEIPVEKIQKSPLCMWQYGRIYSVTRVPLAGCDALVQADTRHVKHITVFLRDQAYLLNVYHENNVMLTSGEIEFGLLELVKHVESIGQNKSVAVPLLTSAHRDHWALAREHLLTLGNREILTKIEDSLFSVALDDFSNGSKAGERTKTMFCGHQGLGNGHNRWYDKSFTLIVESNGQCGFMGEHSPVDALIVSWIFDYMLQTPCAQDTSVTHKATFEHLPFKTDALIDRYIQEAQQNADTVAALSDSNVLIFKDFGTTWVKKTGKVSPDAFYQMALQLMYYRLHGKCTATYETAATRKYLRGRTETIRSCSTESKAFVEAFDNSSVSAQDKYALLVKAVNNHRTYTKIASDGFGCDRHLLALRLLLRNDGPSNKKESHALFTDPIFVESQTWRLSTSGLHQGIRLMGTGFGAIYQDGYGINYMAAPDLVKFGIESKKVPETASTNQVMETIEKVLLDMKKLCEQVNQHAKL
ncbi:acyltransferase ChoActase/COT/CPT [Sporodiniella umbellata]|nr:acyltransferase ChoActase/COT/CPT [Sporodiniella umbellata]